MNRPLTKRTNGFGNEKENESVHLEHDKYSNWKCQCGIKGEAQGSGQPGNRSVAGLSGHDGVHMDSCDQLRGAGMMRERLRRGREVDRKPAGEHGVFSCEQSCAVHIANSEPTLRPSR